MDKIKITSDGTSSGTKVYINNIQVENLELVKFECKLNKTLAKLTLGYVYPEEAIEETTDEATNS